MVGYFTLEVKSQKAWGWLRVQVMFHRALSPKCDFMGFIIAESFPWRNVK